MKYRWSIAPPQAVQAQSVAAQLKISPLLAQCLLNRGIIEPERVARFLDPRLAHLADPFLLPDMQRAVDRLAAARAGGEALVIFGDYDVDGVTSTTLLHEFLAAHGWTVHCHLPHRMDDGYGLTDSGVENCLQKFPVTLVLAVDCGSASSREIALLRKRGVDVVVLDHHQVSSPPPEAVALVNAHCSRAGEGGGPFTELCSAGLAFKLCHALLKHDRAAGRAAAHDYDLRPLLDLVALGTVADMVPLTGENRIFVNVGLQRLQASKRPGLAALKQVAGISTVGTYEVGFQLGPRLNAAGRLETALDALHLLQAATLEEALPLAQRLDQCNRERQEIQRRICDELLEDLRARFDAAKDFVCVAGNSAWHVGVVGIVASRVLNEFFRPAIVMGGDGDLWRGSGRSVEGFDLAAALRECGDLLERHGGHAMAAGVTIRPGNIDSFRERINSLARKALRPDQLQPSLRIDGEVTTQDLTIDRLQELERLHHTGLGNPAVHFCLRNATHARALQRVGANKQHAKMWITDGRRTCEAVLWGAGEGSLPVGKFDVAFAPQINRYNGAMTVQLKVLDWRASGDTTML